MHRQVPGFCLLVFGLIALAPGLAQRQSGLEEFHKAGIWQIDLANPGSRNSRTPLVADSARNVGAQISPDGQQLVFQSNRSGNNEIWISDRDGSNRRQMTFFKKVTAGSPRWSPDRRKISYDVDWTKNGVVMTMDVFTRTAMSTAQKDSGNLVPNWSGDGRWLYFASNRSGDWQVWKMPTNGGRAVQLTRHGGFAAQESPDHEFVFYAKHRYPEPEIWKVPVNGGAEVRVSQSFHPGSWANWAVAKHGIYFINREQTGRGYALYFFDFVRQDVQTLASLPNYSYYLSVSPDEMWAVYEQLDEDEAAVLLPSHN